MKRKNLFLVTGLSLLLGLVSLVGVKNTSVLPAKAEVIENKITVDPNTNWGNGTESYKVAANLFDDDSHSAWSQLVTVTTPSSFMELPFSIDFQARFVRVYRYNVDFSKENWQTDPTGEHYSEYGWTESPVLNVMHDIEFTNSQGQGVINIVLNNDTYGFNSVPSATHQIYLPDEQTWSSEDVYFVTIKENSYHHTEYSVEIDLKENDLIRFEKYFEDVNESKITLDDSVSRTDLEYWESDSNKGFDCKSAGKYIFRLDYKDSTVLVSKIPTPAPTSKTYVYVVVIVGSVTAVALVTGLVLILRKHSKNKAK